MTQKIIKIAVLVFSFVLMGVSIYLHNNVPNIVDKDNMVFFGIGFIYFVTSFYSLLKHSNNEL